MPPSFGSSTPAQILWAGDDVQPSDHANACRDVALTSLPYYFSWAITALVRWSTYTAVTGRKGGVDLHTRRCFDIVDDEALSYEDRMVGYRVPDDWHFEADRYWDWCAQYFAHLPERVLEWVASTTFHDLLGESVGTTYCAHELDAFIAHFCGLVELSFKEQRNLSCSRSNTLERESVLAASPFLAKQ